MALANPSMEVSWYCAISSSRKCVSGAVSLPTRRKPRGGHSKETEKLWEDLFTNPSHWWDNRLDKMGPGHPDFRHKSTREPLWLNSHRKPIWVDARLVSFNAHNSIMYINSLREFHRVCQHGQLGMALHVLFHMPHQPTENMYYSLLKACNERKALAQAKLVQSHLARGQLDATGFLGEYLVITLAKCGGVEEALHVFHRLLHRTVFCWTAIISGYTECGKCQEALDLYPFMQQDGIDPNDYTFASLLKACGCIRDLEEGKRLHAEALKYSYGSDLFVGTSLIDMYAKCGSISLAQNVFDGLSQRNVVSWTAMLSAYVEHGQAERALQLYGQMQQEGVGPDDRAFVISLQACCALAEKDEDAFVLGQSTRMMSLGTGQVLHTDAWIKDFDSDVFVGNSLVSMYGKCGSIMEAENVFGGLPFRDIVSWNAMLSAYVEERLPEKALQLFRQMKHENVIPDDRTFVSALQACGMLGEEEEELDFVGQSTKAMALEIGQGLHAESWRKGLDSNSFVGHTLVNLYGSCGSVGEAESAFGQLSEHTVVSWTVMSLAYLKQGEGVKALQIYKKMQDEGVDPNERFFINAVQACCLLAEKEGAEMPLAIGKALHADAQRKGFDLDTFVGSTLMSMYIKCGSLVEANNMFCELSQDHVVSWNAMLSAYIEQGEGHKALQLYGQMQEKGVKPTDITLVCALQACSETGSVEICREIHYTLVSAEDNLRLLMANTLIHTYGTCASMLDAQAIFDVLPRRDVASWNALIGAYAQQGHWAESLHWYEKMQQTSVKPDQVTFSSVLSACCHAGLVEKGVEYLESMSRDYNVTPEIGHYSSIIDLLGRAGDFVRVGDLLSSMPMQPDLAMWLCLLGACQMHGNIKLGRHAYDQAMHLQPKQAAAYVMMSNIYADAGLEGNESRLKERAGSKLG